MAPHSSTLAWRIPWMEKPGGLQSMRPLRVRHDWATSLSLFTFLHWRRKWQPTPVFLPGESQGWGSLVGCRLWGHIESDTTDATNSSSSSKVTIQQNSNELRVWEISLQTKTSPEECCACECCAYCAGRKICSSDSLWPKCPLPHVWGVLS